MAEKDTQNGRGWLWWLAAAATAVVLLAAAGAGWYYTHGGRVWTDGRQLRVADTRATVREVLWTAPKALGQRVNTAGQEYEPALGPGDESLYFVRGLPGEDADILFCRRGPGGWTDPEPLAAVNTSYDELGPRVSPDGRFLMFYSDRPGGLGQYDLWVAERTASGWSEPVNAGPSVNSPYNEYGCAWTPDGRRVIFATNRVAAAKGNQETPWRATIREQRLGDYDLFVADRSGPAPAGSQPASRPTSRPAATAPSRPALAFDKARALEGVNTSFHDGASCVSPAGDFLYFTSDRPGGSGGFDLYRCRLLDGRCGEVVNLGPELNTPANEMDPHLAMGGFGIYFSSDRPGGAGGYDLLTAESREVYAIRDRITPPRLSWSAWALLIALAVLIPLLLFLRAAGYRHLSLLQKCVALSLLAHIGITMLLSLFFIYRPILQHVAEAAGLTTSVNLDQAEEVQMRMHIRRQISDIPMTELPVSDPTLADMSRPRPAEIAPAVPETPELNVPHAKIAPAPATIEPEAPRRIRPRPAPQRVSLPEPPLHREAPSVRLAVEPPLTAAERRPELAREQRPPSPTPAAPTRAPAPAAREVHLAATPRAVRTESLLEAPSRAKPTRVEPAPPAPAPAPVVRAELDLGEPDVPSARVSAGPTTAPAARDVPVASTRATIASPRGQADLADVDAPRATRASASLVAAAAVPAATVPPRTERVAVVASPSVRAEPDVSAPRTAADRVTAESVAPPAVEAVAAVAAPTPTASPQGQADVEALAVPATIRLGESLAVAAAVSRAPQPAPVAVAVDVVAAGDAPEIRLPVLGSAPASTDAEPAPPSASLRAPGELQARPLVAASPSPSPRAVATVAAVAPRPRIAASLIPSSVAAFRRPANGKPTDRPLAPAGKITPLIPLTGPGNLASPDEFFQRSFEQRQRFINAMGGSKETEHAVARALAYLAKTQFDDGHWPFRPGSRSNQRGKNDLALTALATLSFLAGGHTPAKDGPYRQCVRKAADYLVARVKPNGDIRHGGDMYSQAIGTMAIAEAAAMTKDPVYRVAAIRAGRFIVNAQNRRTGGWRYKPGDPGDTSVFGWEVLALRGAERVGMRIPAETRKLCFRWLNSVSRSRHKMLAGYRDSHATLPMTAEAVTSRIFLGQKLTREEMAEACKYIRFHSKPSKRSFYYYWYYGSLALAQMQNDAWRQWNEAMKKKLTSMQLRDGSWDEGYSSNYGRRGGKIYATALSALTLQVYYRYLPMYKPGQAESVPRKPR